MVINDRFFAQIKTKVQFCWHKVYFNYKNEKKKCRLELLE